MRSQLFRHARIAAALSIGLLVACQSGNSPATGNFTILTNETVIYHGAATGSFSSHVSAAIQGELFGPPEPGYVGWADSFSGTSGHDGIYRVANGIVPAKWKLYWRDVDPCYGQSTVSDGDIHLNDTWSVTCYIDRYVIGGYETYDEYGNPISASCCNTDTLVPATRLYPGDVIQSSDSRFTLEFQGDGNLVLYTLGAQALWASNTAGSGATWLDMQGDGNLVVYRNSTPLWSSGTAGHGGAYLIVQDDGNVVLYDGSGSTALWSTGTCCH